MNPFLIFVDKDFFEKGVDGCFHCRSRHWRVFQLFQEVGTLHKGHCVPMFFLLFAFPEELCSLFDKKCMHSEAAISSESNRRRSLRGHSQTPQKPEDLRDVLELSRRVFNKGEMKNSLNSVMMFSVLISVCHEKKLD